MGRPALTAKQQAFIAEYLKCWNASEAARRAGYSERSAGSIGDENLEKPEIAAEIERRKAELLMSPDEVLARLTEQGRAEYAKYISSDGTVWLGGLLRDGKAHLVKKIKPTKFGTEVEFYDAQAALIQMGKAHKLFAERHEVTGLDGGPIQTEHTEKLDLSRLSPDQLRDLRALLQQAGGDATANA